MAFSALLILLLVVVYSLLHSSSFSYQHRHVAVKRQHKQQLVHGPELFLGLNTNPRWLSFQRYHRQIPLRGYNPITSSDPYAHTSSSSARSNSSSSGAKSYSVYESDGLRSGSIVEHLSSKGTKQLALVTRRLSRFTLEVMNEAKMEYNINTKRVSHLVPGNYTIGDLLRLQEMLLHIKPQQMEKLWEQCSSSSSSAGAGGGGGGHRLEGSEELTAGVTVAHAAQHLYRSADALRVFAASRIMDSIGAVYFNKSSSRRTNASPTATSSSSLSGVERPFVPDPTPSSDSPGVLLDASAAVAAVIYVPLDASAVQENLRDRAALREFKQRFQKLASRAGGGLAAAIGGGGGGLVSLPFLPDMPERMEKVLEPYINGLKQFAAKKHPWVANGWSKMPFDDEDNRRGAELLEYLGLVPSFSSAKRVLELVGAWSAHENIEKYIMQIRDRFPDEVLQEAQHLLDHHDELDDPDERLRRDLRHMRTYSIDREGASEVDDAISIERLSDGRDKLWVHIADVSKWIRPGSQLSLEAERRMASIYMPDERISMFPEKLSSELLSLGAKSDSFALSCGVTLSSSGDITSFEVCPSRVRVTRRLTYLQLDDLLSKSYASNLAQQRMSQRSSSGKSSPLDGLAAATTTALESPPPIPIVGALLLDQEEEEEEARSSASDNDYPSPSSQLAPSPSKPAKPSNEPFDADMVSDLVDLNRWAIIRYHHRLKHGALDAYLRHKTELYLNVRKGGGGGDKDPGKMNSNRLTVLGVLNWSNSSSICTVSECMILMSVAIGSLCVNISAPVWYKTQTTSPPLHPADLALRDGETPFLRAARIIKHMHTANDSKLPGEHCTSGSSAYVQCTSPIRRYHDLYNHYHLKVALHRASMSERWADRAEEEAGISLLDSMATDAQRLGRLSAIRLVTRFREHYWMDIYVNKLIASTPQVVFDCMVYGCPEGGGGGGGDASTVIIADTRTAQSTFGSEAIDVHDLAHPMRVPHYALYEALILQLGSFTRYQLYHTQPLVLGQLVQCHLYRRLTNPISYVLLPTSVHREADLPMDLRHPQTGKLDSHFAIY